MIDTYYIVPWLTKCDILCLQAPHTTRHMFSSVAATSSLPRLRRLPLVATSSLTNYVCFLARNVWSTISVVRQRRTRGLRRMFRNTLVMLCMLAKHLIAIHWYGLFEPVSSPLRRSVYYFNKHILEIGCLTVTSKWKWMPDIQIDDFLHVAIQNENGCLTSKIDVWKWMSHTQYRRVKIDVWHPISTSDIQYRDFRKWMSDIQLKIYGCLTVSTK